METQTLITIMQMVLSFGNICILGYAFVKFLNKPHDDLRDKVNAHDVEIKEIKSALHLGNDKFREHDKAIEVMLHSVLAIVEFEMQYCITEKKPMSKELEDAKNDLHRYLAKK